MTLEGGVREIRAEQRIRMVGAMASLGFTILAFRLFHLQVLKGPEMFRLAELNRTQIIPLQAPRGLVLDRNGEVLLDSAPNFSVFFSAPSVSAQSRRDLENELVRWFPDWEGLIHRKLAEAFQTGKMTRILAGVPRGTALALIEEHMTLPGINVIVEPKRRARFGTLASHLLGYVDEIGSGELARLKGEGYRMGQLIGRTGVESVFDGRLRGEDGGMQFEMDAAGRHLRVLRRISSHPGSDLVLTIDRHLQEVLEAGLNASPTKRGAAVAMDPRSGAVLAMASAPGFDPTGSRLPYLADPNLPLFDRALTGTYPPGSVFKIVTAVAALEQAWDLSKVFSCTGIFRVGRKEFACWKKHGRLAFMEALAWSCDYYFYNIGLRIGPDAIEKAGRAFGLGQRTGVGLPSESTGILPGRDWKKKAQGVAWFDGDTANFAIGQGSIIVTPVQVAVLLSAVANGGTLWKPFVVERVKDPSGKTVFDQKPMPKRKVEFSPEIFQRIQEGIRGVVVGGTGQGIARPDLVVGGKTGTAQNPHGEDHAWFAAYAGRPNQPPTFVVVVLVENGGHGASVALPICRDAINLVFPREKTVKS